MRRAFIPLFLAAVFLSGLCSLVYQLAWDRLARDNFGGDNVSATIVVATFLLGLGIGAFLFRRASARPLTAYGRVEFGIGAFAIVSPYVLADVSAIAAAMFPATAAGLEGVRVATVAGCALFLLPPCTLMGATLPMMFAAFFGRGRAAPAWVGYVYGLNLLGAMAGTVAVPAVLLNHFRIDHVVQGAGCLNLAIGAIAMRLGRGESRQPAETTTLTEAPPLALGVAFLTGAVTVVYEVMLIRHAFVMSPSSVYNLPFVLFAVLLSIALGSLVLPRVLRLGRWSPYTIATVLLLVSAAGLAVSVTLPGRFIAAGQPLPDPEKLGTTARYFLALAAPLFLPLGAVFPILCISRATSGASLSQDTGALYLANSIGAVTGAVSFHLAMGAQWGTHRAVAGMVLTLAAAALLSALVRSFTLAALVLVVGVAAVGGARRLDVQPLVLGPTLTAYPHVTLVEGASGTASVGWYDAIGNGGMVMINGQGMGAVPNEPHDMQILAALLAVAHPRHVLVLGVATGSYIGPLLAMPGLESLTLVDWSREIGAVMRTDKLFVRGKEMPAHLDDPRVRFIVADARVAVGMFPDRAFDLVIDTLTRPTWPGATGLRSPRYFHDVARILTDDGTFAMATFYRGWRQGRADDRAWRPEILAGVLGAFADVRENWDAHVVVAARTTLPQVTAGRINDVVAALARPTRLGEDRLRGLLTSGYARVSPRDAAARPFDDRFVQSEYYYGTDEVLRLLRR